MRLSLVTALTLALPAFGQTDDWQGALGPCRLSMTAGPVFTAGTTGVLVRGSFGVVL